MRHYYLAIPLLALALAGCSGTETPSVATTSTSSTVAATESPDDVVDAAAALYWSADSTTDLTPRDATRRATQWLTPTLAATLAEDLPGNPGHEWLELAEHSGKYVVTIEDATASMPDLPTDTPTTASRGRIATLTPVGADGWTGTVRTLVAQFDLTRADETSPWLINNISYSETYTDPENLQDFG